ncbi:MAG: TetR/AcrR family transcriptional regulator [Actinobacteria bacterium HGW-Actinobacteria-5]|jgi:AcrR family transcriptional regulator|nr:MAG: TetR/AcrR family transcriptional regulator [Actinobacteria bacterium HGW-Actinobacteria-5]
MRERILATATGMFVARGYEGVAMREIAQACGITKAALYYHFTGKSDVLNAIFTGYLDEIAAVVGASADHGGGEQRLRWLVRQLFALPAGRRAIMRLAMHDVGQLEPEQRASFGAAYVDRFIGPLQQIVADGVASGEFVAKDPSLVVWILLGMLYPFFAPRGSPAVDADSIDDLLDVFFGGLSA